MPTRAAFQAVVPLLPAGPSLADALALYTASLGFDVVWQGANMAGVRRGTVQLNLIENNNQAWAENCSLAIAVDDLDALYDEYRKTSCRIGPLEVKVWGRREFHLIVPSGVCFQFFQSPTPDGNS